MLNVHVNCDEFNILRLTLERVEIAEEEFLTASPFPFVHRTISLHPNTPRGLKQLTPSQSFYKPNSFPPNSRHKEQIYKNTTFNLTFAPLSASYSCSGKSA